MNTKKIIIAGIAALITSAASFAESNAPLKGRHTPEELVSRMIVNHDRNNDGALNESELADSIENLFDRRNKSVREHRVAMIEKGLISSEKSDNGFITLSPMPEDAAAFLLNGHDANENQILEADELLASTRDMRQLNLGFRPSFARES